MSKHSGTSSKKVQRRIRAKARAAAFEALSPEQREKQIADNKALYHFTHKS